MRKVETRTEIGSAEGSESPEGVKRTVGRAHAAGRRSSDTLALAHRQGLVLCIVAVVACALAVYAALDYCGAVPPETRRTDCSGIGSLSAL